MRDMLELAHKGTRQKLGTYLVMTLLVAFTVGGYLVVSSYWRDAAKVSTASAEPLDFPYVKATVLFAYWSNPPFIKDEEMPPPRQYVPVFSDAHLAEIRKIRGVSDLSVAMCQDVFTKFGSHEMVFVEAGAPLWRELGIVAGTAPLGPGEMLVPEEMAGAGAEIGQVLVTRAPRTVMPRAYRVDSTLRYPPDPEPVRRLKISGVYRPFSSMISGPIGFIPVRRVESYPEENPEFVTMGWPVPNTIFLHLDDPERTEGILADWRAMYRDYPQIDPPLIPPVKVEWTPCLPEIMVRLATGQVAMPVLANTANAFGLGAIGIFAGMFVSFLDRRRDLGIMKTLGIDNARTAATVSAEVVLAGALGTVAGVAGALSVTKYFLKGISGNPLAVPWNVVLAGVTVSSLILACATHVPRAMARQGTVMELLHGRPIPIYRQRR